jgi:hypothetical protein
MDSWKEELALMEAAAMRTEAMEALAEGRFDSVFDAAQAQGASAGVTKTVEFSEWMAARADTDAAWGRWAQVMDARPAQQGA